MTLDIWSRDDIRCILLAALAGRAEVNEGQQLRDAVASPCDSAADGFRAGYEAALTAVAEAFGIRLTNGTGQMRAPGVVIPAGRLALSHRAEKALQCLLQSREELCQ